MSETLAARPKLPATLELLKPVTWFAPMWAFLCGVVSSGAPIEGRWGLIVVGVVLCGPLVCGASQAVNDWFDRHVDAINEPLRPIPSGRMPGRWGLYVAVAGTCLSLGVSWTLGPWGFWATAFGLALAWAYSAPPLRLKLNGWYGNAAVAACYEGLPWVTGAALMSAQAPRPETLLIAALYSLGAHGIMTLNDFKSIEGDRRMGVGSLPARLGPDMAARVACAMMIVPQIAVVALLMLWGQTINAALVAAGILAQMGLMRRLLADPRGRAPWYNATGTSLYVLGMLATGFGLGNMAGATG